MERGCPAKPKESGVQGLPELYIASVAMTLAVLYGQLGEYDESREYFNKVLCWEQASVSV